MVAAHGVYASKSMIQTDLLEFRDLYSLLWIVADMEAMSRGFEIMPSDTYASYIRE